MTFLKNPYRCKSAFSGLYPLRNGGFDTGNKTQVNRLIVNHQPFRFLSKPSLTKGPYAIWYCWCVLGEKLPKPPTNRYRLPYGTSHYQGTASLDFPMNLHCTVFYNPDRCQPRTPKKTKFFKGNFLHNGEDTIARECECYGE